MNTLFDENPLQRIAKLLLAGSTHCETALLCHVFTVFLTALKDCFAVLAVPSKTSPHVLIAPLGLGNILILKILIALQGMNGLAGSV